MNELSFANGYALLIGVGADLPATVRDARALRELLVDPHVAAYPSDQVILLDEQKASRAGILGAFDELLDKARGNPDAVVIIYYSGHGMKYRDDDGTWRYCLVPYGYAPETPDETTLSGAEFTRCIEALQPKKLLVLLDCCHAGGVTKARGPGMQAAPIPEELIAYLSRGSGRVVIASSKENELSYVERDGVHSVFTACLLDVLRGQGVKQEDGYVRLFDVMGHLLDEVPRRAAAQHPLIKEVRDLDDNFPLCYYAGGANAKLQARPAATSGTAYRSERMRGMFQAEWNLLQKKVLFLKRSLLLSTRADEKFALEVQITDEMTKLGELERKLTELEQGKV